MLYEVSLAQRLENSPTTFSSDKHMVTESEHCWDTSQTPNDSLIQSDPVVTPVLDGEKVGSKICLGAIMTTLSDPRFQQQQPQHPPRYKLSMYW
ncbi:hypothetical protein MRX96_046376 [Rhipicephalus microplus]